MPKEWTHFHVARQAHLGLPDVALRRIIGRQPHFYLLGAVLPDAPLYAQRLWPARDLFRSLGRRIHDPEQGSLLVRRYLCGPGAGDEAAAALGLGALAHLLADALVHPVIDDAAGGDLGRHFDIETRLDLVLASCLQADRLEVAPLLCRCGKGGWQRLAGMVAALFAAPGHTGACAWMLCCHGGLQFLFARRLPHRFVLWLQRRGVTGMGAYRRLFYRDPGVTGEDAACPEVAAGVAAVDRAVAACCRLFATSGDVAGLCARDPWPVFSGGRSGRRP